MRRYGVRSEVLTENGARFTGRHNKPQAVEVLFERICGENGITQRRTRPRSPTTTGKIERLHKALPEEFLDHVAPFESVAAAQDAINGWVEAYNHRRPHQALDMAVPANRFRPNGPTRIDTDRALHDQGVAASTSLADQPPRQTATSMLLVDVIKPPTSTNSEEVEGNPVEFVARVPPGGEITVLSGRQRVSLHQAMAGRTVTVWADLRSVHVLQDGHVVRTVASGLRPEALNHLTMRGARPTGPPPANPKRLPTTFGKAAPEPTH